MNDLTRFSFKLLDRKHEKKKKEKENEKTSEQKIPQLDFRIDVLK